MIIGGAVGSPMYPASLHTMQRVFLSLLIAIVACVSSRPTDRGRVTGAELERISERDTVYARRVRMFEQIAASIPKDSLVRLYTGAMTATPERGGLYQDAIACQMERMIRAYGAVAAAQAVRQVEDSLFPPPDGRRRWAAITSRWPSSLGDNYHCDVRDLSPAPDSLNVRPVSDP